jgi:O-acetyl-ADP-ribose deacetylase (regulator of RNase III)
MLDEFWSIESLVTAVHCAASLDRLSNNGRWTDAVSPWRGDITPLEVGAIVNAANSGLTGCYVPFHACVDNAIHTAAGPRLRQACEAIMVRRGRPEPVATATVTPGFYLLAKHVLHTVGPMVHGGDPSPADGRALAGCYRSSCLEAAMAMQLDSIAFCAISTGICGYPKGTAARVSLSAIQESLASDTGSPHVVLVAFSAADEAVYRNAIEETLV